MVGTLHVVAGIPGTGVRASLDRFCNQPWADSTSYVSLEQELEELARPEVERLFVLGPASILGALLLPKAKLRELWREALSKAWDKVTARLENGNVLFTFHLCYFHHLTREHVVPADYGELTSLLAGRANSVITLIDDVYDCQRRLSAQGGRFDPPTDIDSAILDALKVLDWRSNEILLADWLSQSLKCQHFVFAVKHPTTTFRDLLYSDKEVLYLSHPISEPRRMWRAGSADDANAITNHTAQIVSRLQTRYTVIEPTGIDEFRFLPGTDGHPTSNLDDRWPFHADGRQLLYIPPTPWPAGAARFGFPFAWHKDPRVTIPSSPLLREFQEAIEHQIGARDHALVEQSKRLACFRPLYQGNPSKGVREELEHLGRLMSIGGTHEHAVCYCPRDDRAQFTVRQLCDEQIEAWRRDQFVSGTAEAFDTLKAEIRAQSSSETVTLLSSTDACAVATALGQLFYNVEITVTPATEGLPTGALGSTEEARRDLRLQDLTRSWLTSRQPYLDAVIQEGGLTECETEDQFFRSLNL